MRLRVLLGAVVFAGAVVFMTARVVSQCADHDHKEGGQGDQAMQAWMKYAAPGEYHAHLEPLVGKWEQSVKWWMAPGMPPETSTGTSEYKWILGKRFLQQHFKGESGEQTFEGMGLIGYDNFKKKYTSMWTDNMSTSIMTALGTCDESGKVFTMIGKHDDVFSGKPNQEFRSITRIVNNTTVVDEMFMHGPDGKEYKAVEVTYTRKR